MYPCLYESLAASVCPHLYMCPCLYESQFVWPIYMCPCLYESLAASMRPMQLYNTCPCLYESQFLCVPVKTPPGGPIETGTWDIYIIMTIS